ncbi:MAG: ATP-dependent DNA helicase [Pirellula sp.]|jgi:ATP-dependent DNA helicase RecQ|nr:ATP-dependent DNA helicase [Pirellula sp.]
MDANAQRELMVKCLQETFQLDSFRDGQLAVIESLLSGHNAAAIFPTGGGKSLCYQLPACLLPGVTLVVSPLLALMRDQVDRLVSLGVPAVRLDSSLAADEARNAMSDLRSGRVKLLYVAPERFFNERFREVVNELPLSLMAIDESHCISQWGHNFRPDYLKLSGIAKSLKVERILALSATATPSVIEDIKRGFSIEDRHVIQTPFHRPNLAIRLQITDGETRARELLDRLESLPRGCTIIYVTTQKTSEELAEWLVDQGFEARAYHAGLEDDVREGVQDWFMSEQNSIVVATIAFGMGIDKRDVRYVYHWNLSKGIENYAQEIGRAGRDGLASRCETWIVPEDRVTLENFAYGDTPTYAAVKGLLELLAHQPERFYLSFYSLASQFDAKDIVIRTILTYLELDGYVEGIGPRYDCYEFKPFVSSAEILKHFEGERRTFVRDVLSLSVKKKIWIEVPVTVISERLKVDRKRIVSMVDYLAERGWIELKVSGMMHGYRRAKPITDIEELARSIHQKLEDLEQREIGRIDHLFQLAVGAECQSGRLAEYFGQKILSRCGVCCSCTGESSLELPHFQFAKLGTSALSGLKQLIREMGDLFEEPRVRAKFLCGLSTPSLTRKRMSRHPLYGCCSSVPFPVVLEAVSRF